mgnify:CR=1 FL=1
MSPLFVEDELQERLQGAPAITIQNDRVGNG